MKPTLVVLAAGVGSRYGGLKQIDPIGPNGETIIDYSVFDAIRAGFGKVVFVIRRDIESAFDSSVVSKFRNKIPVEYTFQELDMVPEGTKVPAGRTKPWGTGHAILCSAAKVAEPFAVINADDFYGSKGFHLLARYLQASGDSSADYAMVGFTLRNTLSEFGTVARGVCQCDKDDFLQDVEEITNIQKKDAGAFYADASGAHHALTGNEIVSMNMWGFTPSLYEHLRVQFAEFMSRHGSNEKTEFFIPTVIHNLIRGGRARVKVLRTETQWFGVKSKEAPPPSGGDQWFGLTYRNDKNAANKSIEELIRRNEYPEKLW